VQPVTRVASLAAGSIHGIVQDEQGAGLGGVLVSALGASTAVAVSVVMGVLTFVQQSRRQVEVSYRVQIQNAKSDSATVQVYDEFPGRWEVLSSTVPPQRLSSSSVRFAVPVPAGGEATLEYRVRVSW
jgi:hypothetical protein